MDKLENRNTENAEPTAENSIQQIAIENTEQTLEYSEIENDSNETLPVSYTHLTLPTKA